MAESSEARRRRARRIARDLARAYSEATRTVLRYRTPFQLLVATILSAQCTDKKVNEVTRELFRHYGTPGALAAADPAEIERLVRPTGFYRQKTRSLQTMAADARGAATPARKGRREQQGGAPARRRRKA